MSRSLPRSYPKGLGHRDQDLFRGARILDASRRLPARAWRELAARFGPVEWVLLAILVVLPVAFWWDFASPSYFHTDDIVHLYGRTHAARHGRTPSLRHFGHLAPAYRLTYLALDRLAPMNFEVALAFLVACHAVSAVLLQRILTLVFGRAWWTYALALAWAISVVYLPVIHVVRGRAPLDPSDHRDAGLDPRLPVLAGDRPAGVAGVVARRDGHRARLLREGAADPALPDPDAGAAARPRGAAARLAAIGPGRVAGVARLRGGGRRLPARVLAGRLRAAGDRRDGGRGPGLPARLLVRGLLADGVRRPRAPVRARGLARIVDRRGASWR